MQNLIDKLERTSDLTDEELQALGREYADLFYGCRGPVGRLLYYDLDGGAEDRY